MIETNLNGLVFDNSELIVIGGRPGMGKTALSLTLTSHFIQKGLKGIYLSLECNADSMKERLISVNGGIDFQTLKEGKMNGVEYQRYTQSNMEIVENLKIVNLSNKEKGETNLEFLERLYDQNPDFIFIDYIQILSLCFDKNRHAILDDLMRFFREKSIEKNCLTFIVSQLSRSVEERQGHRPYLRDLKDSGSLEEAADRVLFVLRRDYYDPMDKPGMMYLITAKNRCGGYGEMHLTFRKENGEVLNYKKIPHQTEDSNV